MKWRKGSSRRSSRKISKRKRGLVIFICIGLLALSGGLGGVYAYRQWRFEQRSLEHRALGLAALENGDYAGTVQHLRRYLGRYMDDAEALYGLAQATRHITAPKSKHLADTITLLRRVVELQPQHLEARHQLLDLYITVGYSTEALHAADAVLETYRDDLEATRAKAISLGQLGRFEEALPFAERYTDAEPSDLQLQMLQLEIMRKLGQPDVADVAVPMAARKLRYKYPKDVQFDLLQAYAYRLVGDRVNSAEWLRKVADVEPPNDTFETVLLQLLDEAHLEAESLAVLERGLESGRRSGLEAEIVRRLWESNQFEQLADRLKEIDLRSNVEVLVFGAMALYQLQRSDDAKEIIDLLAAQKSRPEARAWAKVIETVFASPNETEPRRVVEACLTGLARIPNNPYLFAFLGDGYAAVSEVELALSSWQRAIDAHPRWFAPRLKRIHALLINDRAPLALVEAVRAVAMAPNRGDVAIAWALARAANLTYSEADTPEDVLAVVDEIQRAVPGEAQTLPLQISLMARTDKRVEAIEVLKEALAREKRLSEDALLRLAEVSRDANLGLEYACYERLEQIHGLTPRLAVGKALHLATDGNIEAGRELLDQPVQAGRKGTDLEWDIALVQFLERTDPSLARSRWMALADENPEHLGIQRLALRAPSAQTDFVFLDRTIDRVRTLTGEQCVTWRLERARWLQSRNHDGDMAASVPVLKEIVGPFPKQAEARLILAGALERLDQVPEAIEQLQFVSSILPRSIDVSLELARLLQSQGSFEGAAQQLQRVLADKWVRDSHRRRAAFILAGQGEDEEAVAILRQLQDRTPDDHLLLAKLYRRQDELDQTDQICQKLLETPTPAGLQFVASFYASQDREEEAEQVLAALGELEMPAGMMDRITADHLAQHGETEDAFEHYRAAVSAAPENAGHWYRFLAYLVTVGRGDDAIDATREALNGLPDDDRLQLLQDKAEWLKTYGSSARLKPLLIALLSEQRHVAVEVMQVMAEALSNKEEAPQVTDKLKKMADTHPNFMPVQNLLTYFYIAMKRPKDAAAIAKRACSTFPHAIGPAWLASEALAMMGDWDQALYYAKEWRKRSAGQTMKSDIMIAEAKLRLGQSDEATELIQPYLDRALEAPDQYATVITRYARTHLADNRVEEAANLLAPFLTRSAYWRNQWMHLAVLAIEDPQLSARWLERVTEQIPDDSVDEKTTLAKVWFMLYQRSNKPEYAQIARSLIDRTVELGDASAATWLIRGNMAMYEEDNTVAEVSFRAALERDPNLHIAANNLVYILAERTEQVSEALKLAKQLPTQAVYLDTLAHVQAKAQHYDDALATMESAIRLEPANRQWQLNLAKILDAAGREDEAKGIRLRVKPHEAG